MSRISVIIPAYNAAAFVREAIDSVLAQTHPDVEVIVVDDSSTDDTPAILSSYGDRIRVHRQPNGGVSAARNRGASMSSGEWIAFLDADDVWTPDKLERQLASATTPISYTNRYNFGLRGDLPEDQSEATPLLDGDIFVALMLRGNFVTTSSVMIRRALFLDLGGFARSPRVCEDWDLWLRVAARHEFGVVANPLVGYRFTAASLSTNYRAMSAARREVIGAALASDRGRELSWHLRRRIWSETFRTNGWDAGRSGAALEALKEFARAAVAWPLELRTLKDAVRVCVHA